MAIPSLFRQRKPREFKLVPRYHDPEKEAREAREKRIKQELGMENEGNRSTADSRGLFYNSRFKAKQERAQRNSGIRLIVILLVLFLLVYVFWIL